MTKIVNKRRGKQVLNGVFSAVQGASQRHRLHVQT